MQRRKGKKGDPGRLIVGLVVAALVEVAVVCVFGVVLSWMVTRGWLSISGMQIGGCAALLIAGLTGGVLLCGRQKTMPLVVGGGAGLMLAIACVIGGMIWCGGAGVIGIRLIMPVIGGALAGVLTAIRK